MNARGLLHEEKLCLGREISSKTRTASELAHTYGLKRNALNKYVRLVRGGFLRYLRGGRPSRFDILNVQALKSMSCDHPNITDDELDELLCKDY